MDTLTPATEPPNFDALVGRARTSTHRAAAALAAVADDLERLAVELAQRPRPLCAYCGVAFNDDLHHDDPRQDDHWPPTDDDFDPLD